MTVFGKNVEFQPQRVSRVAYWPTRERPANWLVLTHWATDDILFYWPARADIDGHFIRRDGSSGHDYRTLSWNIHRL